MNPNYVFPWTDIDRYSADVPRFAVTSRILCLIEYLQSEAQSLNVTELWLTTGVTATIQALVEAGKHDAIETLLAGLETLIPADVRETWPLNDICIRDREPVNIADVG